MDLYIEILIIVAVIVIMVGWSWWFRWTSKKNIKNYKPDDDKAKQGEEKRRAGESSGRESRFRIGRDARSPDGISSKQRGEIAEGIGRSTETSKDIPKPSKLRRRELLPTTSSNKSRKNSRSSRNFFKRIRRR